MARNDRQSRPLLLPLLMLFACGEDTSPHKKVAELPAPVPAVEVAPSPAPTPTLKPTPQPTLAKPEEKKPFVKEGKWYVVDANKTRIGTKPGSKNRRPKFEAPFVELNLPTFSIGTISYPATTFAGAQKACENTNARLCAEVEWERACQLGIIEGSGKPEWLDTHIEKDAAIRDAASCSARRFLKANKHAEFRCCRGESPQDYPEIKTHARFRDADLSKTDLRSLLKTIPPLEQFADDFDMLGETSANAALSRGHVTAEALLGWELAKGPFYWSPTKGERALVIAGRSKGQSVIAVIALGENGDAYHAASMILKDPLPIALAFTPGTKKIIKWSSQWGRPGAGGRIEYGEDGRFVFTQ